MIYYQLIPFSCLRSGTCACTSRGLRKEDLKKVVNVIADIPLESRTEVRYHYCLKQQQGNKYWTLHIGIRSTTMFKLNKILTYLSDKNKRKII